MQLPLRYTLHAICMNYIDIIVLLALVYATYQGYRRGVIVGVLRLLSTLISILLAVALFNPVSTWFGGFFPFNQQALPFVVFLLLIVIFESIGSLLIALFDQYVVRYLYQIKILAHIDKILGIIPSLAIAFLLITLIMLLPVTVPISQPLRTQVQQSFWGRTVLPQAYAFVPRIERLANRFPTQSLLYIIPRSPGSDETIALNLPQNLSLMVDAASEQEMLRLLNTERISRGLRPLTLRKDVVSVARAHSQDMFIRNYFSHNNPDGQSPFDRMEQGGVEFLTAGENLAYAPNVEIAHRGLMNSPGHRENILREEFGRVGIGVIDAGIYGKMFTQNFTD